MKSATLQLILVVTLLLLGFETQAVPVYSRGGVATTAHPLATKAAVEMYRIGGNAADAAAAAAFTLAVVEPYSSGIGGGGFALIRMQKELVFMDFREIAPRRARREMYVKDGQADPIMSRDGILSAGVPGAVAGYLELQKKYGTLKRNQVLAPAIFAAANGFKVTKKFRDYLQWRLDVLRKDPEASRIFLVRESKDAPARLPPLGTLLVQTDMAHTLELIARDGAKVFYEGEVAKRLAEDMKTRHGLVDLEDLGNYKVRYRQPLLGTYRGHAVASSPPPSSGGQIVITILNVMETLAKNTAWRSVDWLHTYVEASKRAYADRILLGDPAYAPWVKKLMPNLIAKDRAKLISTLILDRAETSFEIPPGQGAQLPLSLPRNLLTLPKMIQKEGSDTTHLCTLDKDGNAVSMTTTINYGWGSGVVARGTGVVWNDEMDDFAVAPGVPNAYDIVGSEANAVAPGKVPLSSMSPTIVFQGAGIDSPIRMVLGSPGGSRIPTTVAQAIMHHIDHDADIERAIAIGRVHHQHLPDKIRVERFALEPATLKALKAKGHKIEISGSWSNANGIAVHPHSGVRSAAADPRGLGTAAGE
jgi:gamma-glutamyltranspeptidase / glutathione hydrolase